MEYKNRLTKRIKLEQENQYTYFYNGDIIPLYHQLGLYEDIGYSPLELIDILLDTELSKGCANWDMDKIEKWQAIKNRIK